MDDKLLDLLNRAFEKDPMAMHSLMANFVPCNKDFADNSFIYVKKMNIDGDYYAVTGLGLMNGILDSLGQDKIAAKFNDKHQFIGFCKYTS